MDTLSTSCNCTTVSGYLILDCLATFYEQTINQLCEMNKNIKTSSFSMWLGSSLSRRLDFMTKLKFQDIDANLIYAYQQMLVQTLPELSDLGCLEFCQDLQIAYIQLINVEVKKIAKCLIQNFYTKDVQFVIAKSEEERDKIILGFTIISNLECDYLNERKEFFKELKTFPLVEEYTNIEVKTTQNYTNCFENDDSDCENDEIDAIGQANIDGETSTQTNTVQTYRNTKIKAATKDEVDSNKEDVELQAKIHSLCTNYPEDEEKHNTSDDMILESTQMVYNEILKQIEVENQFHPAKMVKNCERNQQIHRISQLLDKFYEYLNQNYLKHVQKAIMVPEMLKCPKRAKSYSNVAKQVRFKHCRRKVNGKMLKWLMKQIK